MFWKLHREKQLELLLFIYLVFLNESAALRELFGTSFKNLTPSSDVSNSSLTHSSSCLFAFSKSVPYCWNSAVSFKETRFEASKTSCFCDRALLRITESVFQMLYSIYMFCWVPSYRNGLPESPYKMLLVDSGRLLSGCRQCKLLKRKPPCLRRGEVQRSAQALFQHQHGWDYHFLLREQ